MNGVCKATIAGVVVASMATAVIFFVTRQTGSTVNTPAAHTTCLVCPDVSHPSECKTSIEILPHERCSTEVMLLRNGEKVYKFSSENITDCPNSDSLASALAAKTRVVSSGISLCHDCCGGILCNRELCGIPENKTTEIEAVRLVGGADERSGRLEVMTYGVWGTVCDDWFENREARVVCRSLGFTNNGENAGHAGTTVLSRSYFGRTPRGMSVLLDDVTCRGNETSLHECGHRPIGASSCMYWDVVGIFCGPVEIEAVRLSGHQNARGGRVEVRINGAWGSVWSPHFDTNTANVICRSLGYNDDGHTVPARDFFTSAGPQAPILLEDLRCQGNETSLNDCEHRHFTDHPMDSFYDQAQVVGVVCGARFDPFVSQVRLEGGNNPREGRLDVMVNGIWGSVCNSRLNAAVARVVCRMLGLPFLLAERLGRSSIVKGSGTINLSRVVCSGSETSLNDCRFNTVTNCYHFEDIGVRCG